MSETDPQDHPARTESPFGRDYSGHLRSVTFLDHAKLQPQEIPVHVASAAMLNGEYHEGLVLLDEPWFVSSEGHATVVSFCVPADRVALGEFADEQWIGGFRIDGVPALAPKNPHWETIHRPAGDVVRVYVYVAEVHVIGSTDTPVTPGPEADA